MGNIKAVFALVLALIILLSLSTALSESAPVSPAPVDLSNMTLDDLIALKDQINLAIWNSKDWKEVTVPQGVWEVGKDIPAGHWTIKPTSEHMACVTWGEKLNAHKTGIDNCFSSETITDEKFGLFDSTHGRTQIDWDLTSGTFVSISISSVVFTPYDGKPAFTFN